MNKDDIAIQLFSSIDEYEINQICTILTENSIPFVRKDSGSGSYMNLYMGQSIQEKTVWINKNFYEKALELIEPFVSNDLETNTIPELDQEEDDDYDNQRKYKLIRNSLRILILGIPVLTIIMIIIIIVLCCN